MLPPKSDQLRAWKELPCGHVWPLHDAPPEPCPFCEHTEIFLDEIVADAMSRAAVRSVG